MNPKTTLVIVALVAAVAITITASAKQVFAQCSSPSPIFPPCASPFTPKSLSSSLSGGEHGAQKEFAPGQEAQAAGGSASDFSPGHEKP